MDNMPPLPNPALLRAIQADSDPGPYTVYGFTQQQMHAYARAYAEQRCAPLVEALEKMVELAEFWINREDTRDASGERYAIWLALGHHSNAMRKARAALAAQEHSNG